MESSSETGSRRKRLDAEFYIVLLFLLFSLYIFLGSFSYKLVARYVPMIIGFIATIMSGMRIYHIFYPNSRIGRFSDDSISIKFDEISDRIKTQVGIQKKTIKEKERAYKQEKKGIVALSICTLAFILFGYLVGIFFAITASSYYVGYRNKKNIFICLISVYFIVYVILYRLLEAPADFGVLLGPILKRMNLI